ncbi:hypothetical protein QAD02_010272 [Eretmocerus hayati]|uniref:Uncharacterized protein n=1 Tax=Eretmocerus hayati TaxID=131215 RepID=A0ACC2NC45_9HYME|nr:hypothetical protein QAD02_010272 [Eretmocerus hayati]
MEYVHTSNVDQFTFGILELTVTGGSDAPPGKYPYQAYIQDSTGFLCGASIIHERYLLTAAQCLKYARPKSISVVVGSTNRTANDGETHLVDKIYIHPEYHQTGQPFYVYSVNDIALLRLEKNLTFNESVKPVKLPSASDRIADNSSVVLTGFGSIRDAYDPSKILQQLELKVLNQSACRLIWLVGKLVGIEETMLCTAGVPGKGACYGDAGSPLVSDEVQVGITSFGLHCGRGFPDIFTRVSSFVDWINETLNSDNGPTMHSIDHENNSYTKSEHAVVLITHQ